MTREEHADYVRWLKSLPRRKDHFRMPCPECSATRSNKVSVTLGFQELPQLEADYGKVGMQKIITTVGNV